MAYYNKKLKCWFKSKRTSKRYTAMRRRRWFGLDTGNNIFMNIFSSIVLLIICAGLVKIIMIMYEGFFPLLMKVIVIGLCGYMLARGLYVFFCFINKKNKAIRRVRRWKKI